ncbi:enoyl-CoA hydratase-related protein [Natroniella sp. ANB-PHB2]|uniref:enoyl-CoA hydratase-related protein n=1 Tax=Natroniella sp. ANB-PHB2 TaxID=3384444 RepID=UPI0038D4A030
MEFQHLRLEQKEGWSLLTVNRPKALNALNGEVLKELKGAIETLEEDENTKAICITGAGKAFVAGADIAQMKEMNSLEAKEFAKLGHTTFKRIEDCSKPVIAAVNGFALGGGCELALACDIRIASEKAKFGQPEINLGIIPGFGGTQRLPKLIGVAKAKELTFTGQNIGAEEALKFGLVNHVVPEDELLSRVERLMDKIVAKSSVIVSLAKEAINSGIELGMNGGLDLEVNLFGVCFSSADQTEGMEAFLEKREAEFKGR